MAPLDFLRTGFLAPQPGMPSQPSNQLLGVGLGLLSGGTPQEQVARAASNFANERGLNKTMEWFKQNDPEMATAVAQGIINPSDAFKLSYQRRLEAQQPKKPNLMGAGGAIYNADTGEWLTPPPGSGNDSEFGLAPQYGVDAQGNPVILQLSKAGTSKQTALPPGVTLSKEPIRLDAGTHYVLLDPITRQPIGQVQKDLAGAEAEKVLGKQEGEAKASAPGDLQAAVNAKAIVQSLRKDPNRPAGTGKSSIFNQIPASPGYDYQNKVNQAKSGAFLSAIEQMRGMGALSNAEGQTATAAVTRMDTATSEEEFLQALSEYEAIIDQAIARAQSRMGDRTLKGPQPNATPDPLGIR